MKKGGIVVLSLFDGMSCGRIALERAGIKIKKYYASEIDKYAQIVSAANYPDIIRLGDITQWRKWKIEKPDLIIGGSPCQGFSFAGKGLNFNDPRSKLFFTFVDIVKHHKPKYFLLENVKMKKEYQAVITGCLGVEPIEINSALVSAQNRKRLYWTNIPGVAQPEDKGILLKDIIDGQAFVNARGEIKKQTEKSNCIDSNYHKGKDNHGQRTLILAGYADEMKGHDYNKRVYSPEGKAPSLAAASGGNLEPKIAVKENFYKKRDKERIYKEKAPTLRKDRFGLEIGVRKTKDGFHQYRNDKKRSSIQGTHVTYLTGKTHRLDNHRQNVGDDFSWRKLTPLECERLQTVPDNFTAHVSNTQRYKMLGNGWTVDVIAHIFRGLK